MTVIEPTSPVLGCWELRSTEPELHLGEQVQMRFAPDGSLTYGSLEQGTWQIMMLTFRVTGSQIITNQPSAPREENTSFSVRPDGSLQFGFAGTQCVFEPVPHLAFEEQLRNGQH